MAAAITDPMPPGTLQHLVLGGGDLLSYIICPTWLTNIISNLILAHLFALSVHPIILWCVAFKLFALSGILVDLNANIVG